MYVDGEKPKGKLPIIRSLIDTRYLIDNLLSLIHFSMWQYSKVSRKIVLFLATKLQKIFQKNLKKTQNIKLPNEWKNVSNFHCRYRTLSYIICNYLNNYIIIQVLLLASCEIWMKHSWIRQNICQNQAHETKNHTIFIKFVIFFFNSYPNSTFLSTNIS